MLEGIVVAAVAVAGALLVFRSRRQSQENQPSGTSGTGSLRTSGKFHAVSVTPGLHACAKAREFADTRFLSAEAPRLPLSGCDQASCTCRFTHHADRRRRDDRRSPFQSSIGLVAVQKHGDRRRIKDRRRSQEGDEPLLSPRIL